MKKPILLSAITSLTLFGNSSIGDVSLTSLEDSFSAEGNYSLSSAFGGYINSASNSSGDSFIQNGYLIPEEYNLYPEVNITSSVSLSENSSKSIPFTYFDAEGDVLTVRVVKAPNLGAVSISNNSILYSPHSNQSGSDSLILQFDDGFDGVVERSISITVTPVTTQPEPVTPVITQPEPVTPVTTQPENNTTIVISEPEENNSTTVIEPENNSTIEPESSLKIEDIDDVVIDEDSSTYTFNINILNSDLSEVAISTSSTESDIATISTSGNLITVIPTADKFGTATVTVVATIGSEVASQTFKLIINSVDDAPVFGDMADIVVDEDSEQQTITIPLTDIDSSLDSTVYSVSSSNEMIADVEVVGNQILVTPLQDMFGESTIKVNANIDEMSFSKSFNLTINPVDDAPTLETIQGVRSGGTESIRIPITLIDVDNNVDSAEYSISLSDSELVDAEVVNGELVVTPKSNISGSTIITVTATINGISTSQSFTYSTERVNSAPEIEKIETIEVESQSTESIEVVELNIYDDMGLSSLTATSSNPKLVSVSTDLENSELLLTLSPNSVGETTVTVKATDSDEAETTTSFKVRVSANQTQVCLANTTSLLNFDVIRGENETQNYITTPLHLPEVLESCDELTYLEWSSSNENIIDTFGNIYKDSERDYTVKLTADIESGGFTSQKSFLLTVPKDELTDEIAVEQLFELLTFDSIRGQNLKKSEIYSELNLYTDGSSGTSISWNSSNENAVSSDGSVYRGEKNEEIKLTATISKNDVSLEKVFNLIVKAQKVNDSEVVANDKAWLTIGSILNQNRDSETIKTALTLYDTGINGSEISWTSSNEEIISLSGEVTRDIIDRYVELSATLQKGDVSDSKDFLLKVIKVVEEQTADLNTSFNRVEDIDGNETKTISMFLDSVAGEISSTVEIDNTIMESIETVISEESVKTILETETSLATIYLNSDGTADSKIEILDENNNSIESGLKVELSGGKTSIESDGTIKASIDTKEAEVKPDGTVSHVVKSESGLSSIATSKLAGSSVNVSATGVKTTYEAVSESESGDKLIFQAVVDTDNLSKSKTLFTMTNLRTGERIELDETLSEADSFSEGAEIEIGLNESGRVEIQIDATLTEELEVK
jgi:hypothetical protein